MEFTYARVSSGYAHGSFWWYSGLSMWPMLSARAPFLPTPLSIIFLCMQGKLYLDSRDPPLYRIVGAPQWSFHWCECIRNMRAGVHMTYFDHVGLCLATYRLVPADVSGTEVPLVIITPLWALLASVSSLEIEALLPAGQSRHDHQLDRLSTLSQEGTRTVCKVVYFTTYNT